MTIQYHLTFIENLAHKLGKNNFTWKPADGQFSSKPKCSFNFRFNHLQFILKGKIDEENKLHIQIILKESISQSISGRFIISNKPKYLHIIGKSELKVKDKSFNSKLQTYSNKPDELLYILGYNERKKIIQLFYKCSYISISNNGTFIIPNSPTGSTDPETEIIEIISQTSDLFNSIIINQNRISRCIDNILIGDLPDITQERLNFIKNNYKDLNRKNMEILHEAFLYARGNEQSQLAQIIRDNFKKCNESTIIDMLLYYKNNYLENKFDFKIFLNHESNAIRNHVKEIMERIS